LRNLFKPKLSEAFQGVWVAVSQTGFTHKDEGYGLNYGTHVGDSLDDVNSRRALLEAEAGAPILWLNQVHGVDVCTANPAVAMESTLRPPIADASIALSSDITLAIMTADCLPAVFVAQNSEGLPVGVAAAHAGWKGLLNGVLGNAALHLAQATGQPVSQVSVWLGPAIGPQSFEVGGEVREAFCSRFNDSGLNNCVVDAFQPSQNPGKWLADIYQLAKIDLSKLGVKQVESANPPDDTFKDLKWFSHRRAALLGRQAGRMATLVRLMPQQLSR
jgi:polyphenol oxidase